MSEETKFYKLAIEASKKTGWFPEVIFTQWQVETGHFKSENLRKNNNIAGQTWAKGIHSESMKGSPRPKAEGGFYIKYSDPVQGYVDFIKKSKRFAKVKDKNCIEEQFKAIAYGGWAGTNQNDYKRYFELLLSVHKSNIKKGNYQADSTNESSSILNDEGYIKEIQRLLNTHGFILKVDGIYGPKTIQAVKDFQNKVKINVDGIVGKITLSKLKSK